MLLLTTEELKSDQDAKLCYICGKRILKKLCKRISYRKIRDHCHYTGKYSGEVHGICNSKFNMPNKILANFHNGSNCGYHFIIKGLSNKFERQFECLGKNTEK